MYFERGVLFFLGALEGGRFRGGLLMVFLLLFFVLLICLGFLCFCCCCFLLLFFFLFFVLFFFLFFGGGGAVLCIKFCHSECTRVKDETFTNLHTGMYPESWVKEDMVEKMFK